MATNIVSSIVEAIRKNKFNLINKFTKKIKQKYNTYF